MARSMRPFRPRATIAAVSAVYRPLQAMSVAGLASRPLKCAATSAAPAPLKAPDSVGQT